METKAIKVSLRHHGKQNAKDHSSRGTLEMTDNRQVSVATSSFSLELNTFYFYLFIFKVICISSVGPELMTSRSRAERSIN